MTTTARPSLSFHRLRRWSAWVLAWFTVTLAAGAIAPSMDPRLLTALCSASAASIGWNSDSPTDDGAAAGMAAHGGVCPLCATPATLPPPMPVAAAPAVLLVRAARPVARDPAPPSRTLRPGLARGPPLRNAEA